jgi:hypothetical protein
MKTFIDCLLEKKGLQSALPFWKLKVTDDELKELIEYIQSKLTSIRFDILSKQERKQRYKEFDRELCLMYALWWNRFYTGRGEKWEPALKIFAIPDTYRNWINEAVKLELTYNKRLNIPLFYIHNSARYIDSVLAQGGLPMRLMQLEAVSSSYENYLYHLISEYKDIDEHDWHKIDKAEDLAKKYLPNHTLQNSDAFLAFSMEIVKSCIDRNNFFDDDDNIRQIIQRLIGRGIRQKKNFKINWAFKIIGNQIKLFYSLDVPEKITRNDEGEYLSFYLEDSLVGYYQKRSENTYIRMPQTTSKRWKEWNKLNKGLSFKIKTAEGLSEESLLNSEPPFIGEPVLLQYHGENMWSTKSNGDGNGMGCLFTKQWICPDVIAATELNIDGEIFMWKELSFIDLRNHPLCFRSETTQEEITLDGRQSPYFFSFSPITKEWIEGSSKSVLMYDGDVRSLFKCYKDDESCNLKLYYKTIINNEYIKYTGDNLPEGTIYMKVVAPDGHSRTFSFFNINDLTYNRINPNTIQIKYGNGICVLMAEQNVEELEDGKYHLNENDNLNGFAPIWFRLYPRDNDNNYIDIGLQSPLQQSCFFDDEGRILPLTYSLSITELYKFHVNLKESTIIKVSYYSTQNDRLTCIARKKVILPKGRYPLDVLKEDVERLFWMFGFDDYREYVSLRINGTNNEIKIRRYTYMAQEYQKEDGTFGIFVTRNNEAAKDLQLFAFAINASEDIVKMDGDGYGHFYAPINNNQDKEYVVFSNDESMLPYYLNTEKSLTIEERNQNKRNTINHIHDLLKANDENEWNKIWLFMEIVKQYKLPYSHSFNCFLAIANDPYLLASFLVHLCSFNRFGDEEIINELQRMEKDLSFGFHYLPLACWQQEKHRIEAIYDNITQSVQEIIGGRDVYVSSNFRYLKALLERRFGDEGILIERKLGLGELQIPPISFNSLNYYQEKIHNAFADFDVFNEKVKSSWFANVELPCPKYYTVPQLMQYMAIVLPQCAAQYAHGADMELWNYNPDAPYKYFIRRMINYMSVYVPEAYNELFTIALLKEPVNQTNRRQ